MTKIVKCLTTGAVAILCLFALSCKDKSKLPYARICPEEPFTILELDTVIFVNCSDNYTKQLWTLPDGTSSSQDKIIFSTDTAGVYKIRLSVGNEDFVNWDVDSAYITVLDRP